MFGPERGDFGKSCRPAGLTLLTGQMRGRRLVRHGDSVRSTALNGVPSASPSRIRRRPINLPYRSLLRSRRRIANDAFRRKIGYVRCGDSVSR